MANENMKWNHVCLVIPDITEAIKFYVENFNFTIDFESYNRIDEELRIAWRNPKLKIHLSMLKGCNTRIELIQHVGYEWKNKVYQAPLPHVCFRVNNLESIYKKLLINGIEFLSEPQIVRRKVKIVFFYGPGNVIHELLQVL